MTCAACARLTCDCPDAIYAGVVPVAAPSTRRSSAVLDDLSEPGSWARALRHRDQIASARVRPHAESNAR